jgi:hypothetical protein
MDVNASGLSTRLLNDLQTSASDGASVKLALGTSALKQSLENEELVLKLLQSVGKGTNLNVEA